MSNIIALPSEVEKAIAKPLPPAAIKQHPTKGYLDTINAAFLMQQLDDIFGVGGWHIEDSGIEWREQPVKKKVAGNWQYVTIPNPTTGEVMILIETYACTKVTLTIPEYNLSFNAYGGSNNDDPGDMMKGAVTDGFTSCCKQLGIGRHVWMDKKGAQDSKTNNYENTRAQGGRTSTPAPTPTTKPAPSGDAVKAATEFMGHYVFGTINDLNDALNGLTRSELQADVKKAAGIILTGHANRLAAAYDKEAGMYMVTAKAT